MTTLLPIGTLVRLCVHISRDCTVGHLGLITEQSPPHAPRWPYTVKLLHDGEEWYLDHNEIEVPNEDR